MAYCSGQDIIALVLPFPALGSLTQGPIVAVCQAASDYADGFFVARWGKGSVPLLTWDTSVTENVAKVSAFRLMRMRGLNSKSPDWTIFKDTLDEAVAWLNGVQRQQQHPQVTLANGALPGQLQPNFSTTSVVDLATGRSARNRGW